MSNTISGNTVTVTASAAANAYRNVASGQSGEGGVADSFGATLQRAIEGVVQTGHDADAKSMQAIAGHGNITDVVTAVSKAELALQTTATIRDRMIDAYQDIMRMPI